MPNIPIVAGPSGGPIDCDQLQRDIEYYEQLIASYKKSNLSPAEKATGIATASDVLNGLYASYAQHCAHGPKPPPFHLAPWKLAGPFGIQVDVAWNTGSVWTVLPVSNNRVLVGTEQGGLWLSEPDGDGAFRSQCLSNDWPEWGVSAMVADPSHPSSIFVGCGAFDSPGALYLGNVQPELLHSWRKIPLPTALGMGGAVTALIVLPTQRILMVGTQTGLGWTGIDRRRIGTTPGGGDDLVFVWDAVGGQISGLVNTSRPGAQNDEFVVIYNGTLLRGTIGKSISLAPVSITWQKTPSVFTPLRVASCKGNLSNNVYCLGLCPNKDGLSGATQLFILRSSDGGQKWNECSYTAAGVQSLASALDFLDPGTKTPNSIAVRPDNPNTVAVGAGETLVSFDGGVTWPFDSWLKPGWHADIHKLHFDESGCLWIPSDGGVLRTSPLAPALPISFQSEVNRTLPVLMFLAPGTAIQTLGNVSVGAGFIGGATQDNNNVWLRPGDQVWRPLDSTGDGGMVAFFQDGPDVLALNGSGGQSIAVSWAVWNGSGWVDHGKVPVNLGSNSFDGTGLAGLFRSVLPGVGLQAGRPNSPVVALCSGAPIKFLQWFGVQFAVFGAIGSSLPAFGQTKHFVEWVVLGKLPSSETITALEAFDSKSVLAGTQSGRLFHVVVGGAISELSFDTGVNGAIVGIASDGRTVLCAKGSVLFAGAVGTQPLFLLDAAVFPPNGFGSGRPGPAGSRSPAAFRGICANRNQKYALGLTFAVAVAEDPTVLASSEVWVSSSPFGVIWHKADGGLPVGVRAADLVFSETESSGQLLLSTYGRSLWSLNF